MNGKVLERLLVETGQECSGSEKEVWRLSHVGKHRQYEQRLEGRWKHRNLGLNIPGAETTGAFLRLKSQVIPALIFLN